VMGVSVVVALVAAVLVLLFFPGRRAGAVPRSAHGRGARELVDEHR
jgi:hypothetical protein